MYICFGKPKAGLIMDTILKFLRQLELNNNKPWFDIHKSDFLEARAHFNALVEKLLERITSFDSSIKGVGINDCTYRIYKDMRFSKDGLPYKTHFGAFIARGGRKSGFSGYYFHIGTGSGDEYHMEPKVLKILREDIELGGGDFDRIIKGLHPALTLDQHQKLKRMPLGFNPDTKYGDYIKLKNFCLSGNINDIRLNIDEIAEIFKSAKPFLDYINRAIEFAKEEM